jgi:peptide deformylase
LNQLIENMFETMYEASGVGLAAPQIGQSIRLFVVDGSPFAEVDEDEDDDPRAAGMEGFKRVFINPIIEEETGANWVFAEGCLSIPKIREDVSRKEKIRVTYYDENWQFHDEWFDGYKARIIQHEYDHIEGILFTDHLSVLKKRMLTKRLTNISQGEVKVSYKMKFPALKKGR